MILDETLLGAIALHELFQLLRSVLLSNKRHTCEHSVADGLPTFTVDLFKR